MLQIFKLFTVIDEDHYNTSQKDLNEISLNPSHFG